MPVNRDAVGARGEAIVTNLLTRRHGRVAPLFRPQFLGEKYPAVDFFVELVDVPGNQKPSLLAQVKATAPGYTQKGRLKCRATQREMANLMRYPVPTFLIGVDENREVAFLVPAITGGPLQYSSLPTTHPLADLVTLQALYEEVEVFWSTHGVTFSQSNLM